MLALPQTEKERAQLLYAWRYRWDVRARDNQRLPPGTWRTWLILAGRGYGKTRTGAETVRIWSKSYRYVNIIGATADDARDIMIDGESGILAVCPPNERPRYVKSERRLEWPSGCVSLIFTADEPERLRGKQSDKLWADELAAWRYSESWDQAMFGLRLGDNPQAIVTTTPKPTKIIKDLMKDPDTYLTRGTTYENRVNLAPAFFSQIIRKYEGTRLGRQELNAEILDDNPDALWQRSWIDDNRVTKIPDLSLVVVGVDPSATSTGDEAGIVVAGRSGEDAYILDDLTIQGSPHTWATAAVTAFNRWKANYIAAEGNNGGEMISELIHTVAPGVPVHIVHASRGKYTRAEPVSSLYEQNRGRHFGSFSALEDEMCQWEPGKDSPNRMDALVWAVTGLGFNEDDTVDGDYIVYDAPVSISDY